MLFDKENDFYRDHNNHISDELFSIDDIEDISVCFIKMPIHIYVSNTGIDIDLISADAKLNNLLEDIKGIIFEQLRKHKILKKVFTKYRINEMNIPSGNFEDMNNLKVAVNKYATQKESKSEHIGHITGIVYTNRILIENELEKFFELNLKGIKNVIFYIDNLDFWSKNSKFITLLSLIPQKVKFKILYNNVGNKDLSERRFKRSIPKVTKDAIQQVEHADWFAIKFDHKMKIIGCPLNCKVIDSKTWVIKHRYYLQML